MLTTQKFSKEINKIIIYVKRTNNIRKKYQAMNTNLEIYAVQSIGLSQKLGKKVLTRKCVTAITSTTENELELIAFQKVHLGDMVIVTQC